MMGLDFLGQPDGSTDLKKLGVDIHRNVHIRTQGLANCSDALAGQASHGVVRQRAGIAWVGRYLDSRVVVLLHQSFGMSRKLLGIVAACTLVDADFLSTLAT